MHIHTKRILSWEGYYHASLNGTVKVVSKGRLHARINYSFVRFAEIQVIISSYSGIMVNLL